MEKLTLCIRVEFKHEGIPVSCELEVEQDAEKAYEMVATKVCKEIKGMTIRFHMNSGEIITHELNTEDIKDMWLKEVK